MKIKDVLSKVLKSESNEEWIDIEQLAWNEFSLSIDYVNYDEQDRLKSYWLYNWMCTDTYVGTKVYFLDDEPVAISTQSGRKCYEYIKWVSEECALKVTQYLLSYLMEKENSFNYCNLEEEVEGSFKLDYNSELLGEHNATLNGEDVIIVERIKNDSKCFLHTKLRIKLDSGEEKEVDIKELDFKYNLK